MRYTVSPVAGDEVRRGRHRVVHDAELRRGEDAVVAATRAHPPDRGDGRTRRRERGASERQHRGGSVLASRAARAVLRTDSCVDCQNRSLPRAAATANWRIICSARDDARSARPGAPDRRAVRWTALGATACDSSGKSARSRARRLGRRPRARLEITAPAPNAVTGTVVDLVVRLDHARLVPATQTGGRIRPDRGHIHVSVDGQLVSMPNQLSDRLPPLSAGESHHPGRVRRVRSPALRQPGRGRRDLPRPMTPLRHSRGTHASA